MIELRTEIIEKCHEGMVGHGYRPNSDFKGEFEILCVGEHYFFARDIDASKGKEFCLCRDGNWLLRRT